MGSQDLLQLPSLGLDVGMAEWQLAGLLVAGDTRLAAAQLGSIGSSA